MTESALKNWSAEQGAEPGDKVAVEGDIVGRGHDSQFDLDDELDGGHAHEPAGAAAAPAATGKPGKKSKKPLLIGLGVAAVLIVGAGFYKKSQQRVGGPMMPATATEESVESAVAHPGGFQQDQGGAVVSAPLAREAQIAPVIGVEPSSEASAPAGMPVAPAQAASMPVIGQAPGATMTQSARAPTPAVQPVPVTAGPTPEMLAAQQLVASLQSDVTELRRTVARLQGELAARPTAPASSKVATPRPQRVVEVSKPAAEPPRVQVAAATPSPAVAVPASPAPIKGKVRTDYRIYAVVEGRVWVKQGDNESEMVDPRSPLLDGSTVLSIKADADGHTVVATSAGEIRTR